MELSVNKIMMAAGGVMTGLGLLWLMSHSGSGPLVRLFDLVIVLIGSVLLGVGYYRDRNDS